MKDNMRQALDEKKKSRPQRLAVSICVVLWRLPELVESLIARRLAGALNKLNALPGQMHRPVKATLPAPSAGTAAVSAASKGLFLPTLLLWRAL